MSRCEELIELISADIDGELDEPQKQLLLEHLETCGDCRRLHQFMSQMSQTTAGLEVDPPDTLLPGLLNRLDLSERKGKFSLRSFLGMRPFTVAAAVILIVALAAAGGLDALKGVSNGSADEADYEGEDSGAYLAAKSPGAELTAAGDSVEETFAKETTAADAAQSADGGVPEEEITDHREIPSDEVQEAEYRSTGQVTEAIQSASIKTTIGASTTSRSTAAATSKSAASTTAAANGESITAGAAEPKNAFTNGLYAIPAELGDETFAFRMALWTAAAPQILLDYDFVVLEDGVTFLYRVPVSLHDALLRSEVYAGEAVYKTTAAGPVDPDADFGLVIVILKKPE